MNLLKRIAARAMQSRCSAIDALYQRHAGESCYLFGDGASLKFMDLDAFSDRPSIISHHGIYHRDVEALNVKYCSSREPFWFYPFYRSVWYDKPRYVRHRPHEEYRRTIRRNPDVTFLVNISNYPVLRGDNLLWVSRWYKPPFAERNPFAERPDAHEGTLRFQISLAIYLGFREATLVGHDYTHYPARGRHFYEIGDGVEVAVRYFAKELIEYAKPMINLATVTLSAGCETMPAITYEELTGRQPRFRENTELLEPAKLHSISLCPEQYVIR
jgi:hypothetical protein